jgi:hypothetical protein
MSDITYLARSDYTIIEQAGRRTVLVATGASTYTYQLEELTKLQAQIITIIKTDSAEIGRASCRERVCAYV